MAFEYDITQLTLELFEVTKKCYTSAFFYDDRCVHIKELLDSLIAELYKVQKL